MKTLTSTIVAVLTLVFVINSTASAQVKSRKTAIGFAISEVVTGCGHGNLTLASVAYKNNRQIFNIGLVAQNNYKKISGVNLQYELIIPGEKKLDMYANVTSSYMHKSSLSSKINTLTHTSDFNNRVNTGESFYETFNTVEAYAGIGVLYNVTKFAAFDLGISVGGHYSNIRGTDNRRMDNAIRLDIAPGLSLKAGIKFFL